MEAIYWSYHQVAAPILVIGALVFIHELGHFLVAKWCNVGVVKFSVGFGPSFFKFQRKETVYQLSIIPLGGYVRMVGDMPDVITGPQVSDEAVRSSDESSEKESGEAVSEASKYGVSDKEFNEDLRRALADENRWFINKNYWQRSAIVFAGPWFNFVMAFAVVFCAAFFYGEQKVENKPSIGNILLESPADKAGIKPGDYISTISGQDIPTWDALQTTIHGSEGKPVELIVRRGEENLSMVVQPLPREIPTASGGKKTAFFIGISPNVVTEEVGFWRAIEFGYEWTVDKTKLTYYGLWGMFSGQVSPKDLAGPLFIVQAVGQQSEKGFDSVLYLTALLSVSLAVLNLLPIPILDGGHLLFFLIEALLGPISIRKKEMAQSVGMILLICLMVFAIKNDITRAPLEKASKQPTWEDAEKK